MSDSLLDGALDRAQDDLYSVAKGYPAALSDLERDLAAVQKYSGTEEKFQKELAQLNKDIPAPTNCNADAHESQMPSLYIAGLSDNGKVQVVQTFHGDEKPTTGILEVKDGMIVVNPADKTGFVEPAPSDPTTHRELFSDPNNPLADIEPNRSQQKDFADCGVRSTAAELATVAPQDIKNMVKDNKDGTYTVTFGGDKEHPVTVDTPSHWEMQTFGTASKGIWPAVIEKAYRKYEHRDFHDGVGEVPSEIASFFTGKAAAQFKLGSYYDDDGDGSTKSSDSDGGATTSGDSQTSGKSSFPTLKQALDDDQKIHSTDAEHMESVLKEAFSNHDIVLAFMESPKNCSDSEPTTTADVNGVRIPIVLESDHTYAVIGYDPNDHTVTLRNPWGVNRLSGSDDDIAVPDLKMPVAEFYKKFSTLAVGET